MKKILILHHNNILDMTRINVGISVKELSDEHLLAEHREIKRLTALYDRFKSNIPSKFTLGKGHVLFFADKYLFTLKRYIDIYDECINRGFDVVDYRDNWRKIPKPLMNDYKPSDDDRKMLIDRINDRILNGRKDYYHYYGVKRNKKEFLL